MNDSILDTVLLAVLVLGAVWTVMTPTVLRSVVGLALTSIGLTIVMFRLRSPLAAVFELSVCAGLISAIFISTISLTQPDTETAIEASHKERLRRYWYLPVLMVLLAAALLGLKLPGFELRPVDTQADVRHVLWSVRHVDLVGQIVVLLAGAFGVVALFKEWKKHVR